MKSGQQPRIQKKTDRYRVVPPERFYQGTPNATIRNIGGQTGIEEFTLAPGNSIVRLRGRMHRRCASLKQIFSVSLCPVINGVPMNAAYPSEQSTSSSDIPRLAECSADEDQLHGHHPP
jgi:hypothetical protein